MAEKAVFYARAVVYYFDPKTKGWTPTAVGQNFCRVDMYENTTTNAFRVIGRGLQDTSKVVINSNVTKDTQYTRASETFHQWSDNRYIYGLNFVTKEEAESFGTGFETTVTKLKGSPTSSNPPPQPPTEVDKSVNQAPQPPPQPQPPLAPEPPKAPIQPKNEKINNNPPPAPQPPPTTTSTREEGGGDENRSSLLASISGFKGGLKKVQTVDKSSPIITKEEKGGQGGSKPSPGGMMGDMLAQRAKMLGNTPVKKTEVAHSPVKQPMNIPIKQQQPRTGSVSTGTGGTPPTNISQREMSHPPSHQRENSLPSNNPVVSNGNGISNSDLVAMKEEILAEMRKEIQAMKEEILAAILNR